jgi:hypothetical protein
LLQRLNLLALARLTAQDDIVGAAQALSSEAGHQLTSSELLAALDRLLADWDSTPASLSERETHSVGV